MAGFVWDARKNERLKAERGVEFGDVVRAVAGGRMLDVFEHPNQRRYSGQLIAVVEMNGYAYLVPFIDRRGTMDLKTIIPSRKATKRYLRGGRAHG
ncbi:MAG: BrnT family toxin [bacterium]